MPDQDAPKLQRLALSKAQALAAFFVPVFIALGAYYSEVVEAYQTTVVPLDPWNHDKTIWRKALTAVLLLYTAMMFVKQWGYYFDNN